MVYSRSEYFQKNKEKEYLAHRIYIENNPWLPALYNARKRCTNPNDKRYYCYGARGIKCTLTVKQIKELWLRDKASDMVCPSIDRENVNKNYTFSNCRFIEFKINSVKDKYKKIYEIRNNIVIKIWNSLTELRRETGWDLSTIHDAIRRRRVSHGSYWKR